MKWLKNRNNFINEAKLKDVLLPIQSQKVASKWGVNYLDYEEIIPSDNIKQGKWLISDEDKYEILDVFFSVKKGGVKKAEEIFSNLNPKFIEIAKLSLQEMDKRYPRAVEMLTDFDLSKPSIDQLVALFDPIFRKLSNETAKDTYVLKDAAGRPVKNDEGVLQSGVKKIGEPIFEKNYVNLINFISGYNAYYKDNKVEIDTKSIGYDTILKIVGIVKEDINSYSTSYKIFDRDLYLSISHNPKDILNMSISKFYSSCQHLYTGGQNTKLLANVVDPNSIPAFLVFDTPVYNNGVLLSETLSLSRMIIRNIDSYYEKNKEIFFDRAYPDRMSDILYKIITKYSGNKQNTKNVGNYMFTPDLKDGDTITPPYMDRLQMVTKKYIGVNIEKLTIPHGSKWGDVVVSPKTNLKELVICSPDIPPFLITTKLRLKWLKIMNIDVNFIPFKDMNTEILTIELCKIDNSNLLLMLKGANKIQINSCDITGLDLKNVDISDLSLLYTIDDKIEDVIGLDTKIKTLTISGDLINNVGRSVNNYSEANIKFINTLIEKGVDVKIKSVL